MRAYYSVSTTVLSIINMVVTQLVPDRIFDNYLNATIFITGGTGFLGKVIIERLLRVFDVKTIYILIRSSKKETPSARLDNILADPLYDTVRKLKGKAIFQKCKLVVGDVLQDGLGLNDEDREILRKQVEFVIHSAATVRFDEPLRKAIRINTKGTVSMLQLASEMEKLKFFAYISTAYCHPEQKVLKEIVYPTKYNYEHIIKLADWFEEDVIESMKPTLMGGLPNTYIFSKALAEDAVAKAMDTLPIVIMRPSIVIPIWKEPLPGWTDNINGATGILLATGKGLLRNSYGDSNVITDFVPVDVVADNTLVIGAYWLQTGAPSRVFNISSRNYINETWNNLRNKCMELNREEIPFNNFVWVPKVTFTNSKFVFYFLIILQQLIPALIIDKLLPLFGHTPFLWKAQMRVMNSLNAMQYFAYTEWIFENHSITKINDWLNTTESGKYLLVVNRFDMKNYMRDVVLGIRRYIVNEPDETIPQARRFMRIMIWVDRILTIVFRTILAYSFYKIIALRMYNWTWSLLWPN